MIVLIAAESLSTQCLRGRPPEPVSYDAEGIFCKLFEYEAVIFERIVPSDGCGVSSIVLVYDSKSNF